MNDLNDRIAKALGVGAVEKADSETIIAALVVLVTDVDMKHSEHIDLLQETIDELEFEEKQALRDQVRCLQQSQHVTQTLVEMVSDLQPERFDIAHEE